MNLIFLYICVTRLSQDPTIENPPLKVPKYFEEIWRIYMEGNYSYLQEIYDSNEPKAYEISEDHRYSWTLLAILFSTGERQLRYLKAVEYEPLKWIKSINVQKELITAFKNEVFTHEKYFKGLNDAIYKAFNTHCEHKMNYYDCIVEVIDKFDKNYLSERSEIIFRALLAIPSAVVFISKDANFLEKIIATPGLFYELQNSVQQKYEIEDLPNFERYVLGLVENGGWLYSTPVLVTLKWWYLFCPIDLAAIHDKYCQKRHFLELNIDQLENYVHCGCFDGLIMKTIIVLLKKIEFSKIYKIFAKFPRARHLVEIFSNQPESTRIYSLVLEKMITQKSQFNFEIQTGYNGIFEEIAEIKFKAIQGDFDSLFSDLLTNFFKDLKIKNITYEIDLLLYLDDSIIKRVLESMADVNDLLIRSTLSLIRSENFTHLLLDQFEIISTMKKVSKKIKTNEIYSEVLKPLIKSLSYERIVEIYRRNEIFRKQICLELGVSCYERGIICSIVNRRLSFRELFRNGENLFDINFWIFVLKALFFENLD